MLTIQQMMRAIRDLQSRVQKLEQDAEKAIADSAPKARVVRPKQSKVVEPTNPVTEI